MSELVKYYKQCPIMVIYHGNCADGFGAACGVREKLGDEGVEYHPGVYQQDPPDIKGKHLIFVDFSYKPEVMQGLRGDALSILVLDHHKSAMESYEEFDFGNGYWDMSKWDKEVTLDRYITALYQDDCENCPWGMYVLFDMSRSGAKIAWEFFNEGEERPILIDYIEDRDLWNFNLPMSRDISAAVFSYEYDFDVWSELFCQAPEDLAAMGATLERKHFKDIKELLKICEREVEIGGYTVPVASLPYTMGSDAGHIMCENKPFAACYWDTKDARIFSLRSSDEGEDVSIVAIGFGGGGHRNAAGFSVPRNHRLAMI